MANRLEEIRKLCLMDDLFMSECLKDIPCVELVLSIILNRPVSVEKVQTQEFLRSWGRSVRLDVLGSDRIPKTKDRYNVEVQRKDDGASIRRARFHISIMDTYSLLPRQDFDELGDNYVIFITENDVLDRGLPLYTIDRSIRETGERIDDGSHIIYVNGAMRDEATPLGRLMHDFFCVEPDDMYYSVLADRVRYFKEDERGANEMSSLYERLLSQGEARGITIGKAEGRAEGRAEGILKTLVDLIRDGILSIRDAASRANMTEAEFTAQMAALGV